MLKEIPIEPNQIHLLNRPFLTVGKKDSSAEYDEVMAHRKLRASNTR